MSWQEFRKELEKNKKSKPYYHRNFELDFVLEKVCDLSFGKNNIKILDIGCCESMLVHEFSKRGYDSFGLDIRDYDKSYEGFNFIKADITKEETVKKLEHFHFYYITAISSIEHIGLPVYGSPVIPNGDRISIENIAKILNDDGLFVITVPLKYWGTDSGRGYTLKDFKNLIKDVFEIFEIKTSGGQICAVLTKL